MKRFALTISLSILLSRFVGAAVCAAPGFVAPDRYALPGPSPAVATGDFNNDGIPDVATLAQDGANGIAVLIGKPDGTFQDAVSSGGPGGATLIATGYFNADGNLDIVTASYFSPVRLYAGYGDGTFQAPVEISNSSVTYALTVADVDGDGNADVIFADSGANNIKILLGYGDGTFADPLVVEDSASSIGFGKVDSNDTLDLVLVGGQSGGVTVYPGNGDGTFGSPTVLDAGFDDSSVSVGDVDGDGKQDIAVINNFFLIVYRGNGDGTFQPGESSFAGAIPWRLALADLNEDGFLDAVVSEYDPTGGNFGYPFLQVFLGVGDGTLTPGPMYALGQGPFPLAIGDFGNQGHPGVAVVGPADAAVDVFPGNGDGTLRGIPLFANGSIRTTAVAVGRFDETSPPGVAQLVDFAGASDVFLGTHESALPLSRTLTAADFDGDGHLDLLTVRATDHSLLFLRGAGDGSLAPPIASAGPEVDVVSAVAAADLDGDGHPDLVMASQNAAQTVGAIIVFLGNGDGTFRPGVNMPVFVPPAGLVTTDLNGDGAPDLALAGGVTGQIGQLLVFLGQGDGTFVAASSSETGPAPSSLVTGDFVEDGIPDLAIAAGNITIWRGNGDGSFFQITENDTQSRLLAAADHNGDGHLDLATENSFLTGAGDGSFVPTQNFVTGLFASSIASADLDGDGLPEAAVGQYLGGGYAVLDPARALRVSAVSAIVGNQASLAVTVIGFAAPTFQWSKDGMPVLDGGSISGATTATLTIQPVTFANVGSYQVVVTDACGTLTSVAAPLVVEFADVPPTNGFHDDILTIADVGITAGCGGANYCPTALVTRAQMAVFLLKSEHGATYVPPTCTGFFPDVACPSAFADWIEQLATEGVTAGCGGGNYCPGMPVTRAQMAIFLSKTLLGSGWVPSPATGIFGDVPPGSFGADYIEYLYQSGVTAGCSSAPLLYCPDAAVSRQQMAPLLVKTFHLG